MSSSNLVRIAAVAEVTPGTTPGTAFATVRKVSDSLSGTPVTAESAEARADRQTAGQLQVGLEVAGDVEVELSPQAIYTSFLSSAMKSAITAAAPSAATTIAVSDTDEITITGADLTTLFDVNDLIRITGFSNAANNVLALVVSRTATVMQVLTKNPLVVEADTGTSEITRPSYYEIGTTEKTFTIEKRFMDLTDRSLVYRGASVDAFSVNFEYGSIVTATFGFVATDYEAPVALVPSSVTAADGVNAYNASSDVGLVIVDGEVAPFCIQSFGLELANNSQANNCVGTLAPTGYTLGSAAVSVSLSAYLADSNWDYIDKKINNESVSILSVAENSAGGIAFYVPSVQLSFPDPAGEGRDAQVTLEMAGTAKYDATLGNTMRIYLW